MPNTINYAETYSNKIRELYGQESCTCSGQDLHYSCDRVPRGRSEP